MPLDRNNKAINPGDHVKVLEIPETLCEGLPQEDQLAIQAQLGKELIVESVGEDGTVELTFVEDNGTIHFIWVEGHYLQIVSKRRLADFHDAELVSISHSPDKSNLQLTFRAEDNTEMVIQFISVRGLRIVDFKLQNVVSRLLVSTFSHFDYNHLLSNVTWMNSTYDGACLINESQRNLIVEDIMNNKLTLFVMEPSCGADIVVLAEEVEGIAA